MTAAGVPGIEHDLAVDSPSQGHHAAPILDHGEWTADLVIGDRKLRSFSREINGLRLQSGQEDDFTTEPEYVIAINTQNTRRVTAVLIRRGHALEACVYFFEYCTFGVGLGVLRGGDHTGQSLVIGRPQFRLQYIHFAVQALLKHWRIYGVSFSARAGAENCVEVMGPKGKYRMFSGRTIQYTLPLESSYPAMLAGLGHRTRRSLAGKRQQLEKSANVMFVPSLEPAQALQAMTMLQPTSLPRRSDGFYRARYQLLKSNPALFSMGTRLPDGTWLSLLSGWRGDQITYVDLQMNDVRYKKESLSAVMRCYMLEHEIELRQQLITFVGGTSLLLRRYCKPVEACTDVYLGRPCLRAMLFELVTPRLKPSSFYEIVKSGTHEQTAEDS